MTEGIIYERLKTLRPSLRLSVNSDTVVVVLVWKLRRCCYQAVVTRRSRRSTLPSHRSLARLANCPLRNSDCQQWLWTPEWRHSSAQNDDRPGHLPTYSSHQAQLPVGQSVKVWYVAWASTPAVYGMSVACAVRNWPQSESDWSSRLRLATIDAISTFCLAVAGPGRSSASASGQWCRSARSILPAPLDARTGIAYLSLPSVSPGH